MSATAPSAPGNTTPGWKISKPIPAIPARKSSDTRFGSIRTFRNLFRKDGCTSSTWAPARWSVNPFGTVFLPSSWLRSAGRLGATTSITCIFSAWLAVRFDAFRTASAGQVVLRP